MCMNLLTFWLLPGMIYLLPEAAEWSQINYMIAWRKCIGSHPYFCLLSKDMEVQFRAPPVPNFKGGGLTWKQAKHFMVLQVIDN